MVLTENQKISISSKSENIVLVEKMVEDVCDLFNIPEDHYGNILVALTEAVNNAIYHGNKADPEKNIEISFRSKTDHIAFIIKDEGEGFDHTSLPDPTNPENIEKPHGRGVFLMRNLADKVEFKDKGSTVVLTFRLSGN
ncbi:MAG: ATP-binding protein [Bacteroidota bacterium]